MSNRREQNITDNLTQLIEILPPAIAHHLEALPDREQLVEVVMDLGRIPEARLPHQGVDLGETPITREDLDHVIKRVGAFSGDNRAGIERTLHRISAIRNRQGQIVGLTCRVGRSVVGTIDIMRDLVESGRSILMLGRPGIGKTTKLREIARVLSTDLKKRVIVIDTSNEIAGDGDIPHPAIGRARRMQVPTPALQHAVMIEAVENHMPEVIVIDEIGTEQEALAARTIAERGVQLIGTAHGNSLENLLMNPTLSDLVGGIHTVTLSDEEARRRGTTKSILERKAPPTFDIAIELQDRDRLAVHQDVGDVIDQMLRGYMPSPELRQVTSTGQVEIQQPPVEDLSRQMTALTGEVGATIRIYPYAVSRSQLERVVKSLRMPVELTRSLRDADALLILKAYVKSAARVLSDAEERQIPTYVVKANTIPQIQKSLREVLHLDVQQVMHPGDESDALKEARQAIDHALASGQSVELRPRSAPLRKLQHELASRYQLTTQSTGEEPNRRVLIYPAELFE
ncbi:R3H domain protein [compost metagenome]